MKFLATLISLVFCIPFQNENQGQSPFLIQPLRLISTSENEQNWMTEDEIFDLYRKGIKFIDFTDGVYENLGETTRVLDRQFPTLPQKINTTKLLFKEISPVRMKSFLSEFTSFKTRYYKSSTGQQSAQFLFDKLTGLSKKTEDGVKLTVTKFAHEFRQFSVIARLESISQDENTPIVVLSAHQDSVNMWNPWFGRSPGADDDGSGTTTVMETLTILIKSGYIPTKRVLEFHFYAAEEGGLLGSQGVVAQYVKDEKPVYAVLHSDMTGYQPDGQKPVIAVAGDNVNKELTDVLVMLSEAYADISVVMTKCGYGCSDHASWTKAKIPSSFFFESKFEDHSPFIHSSDDTVAHIDFGHVGEFVKVVIGFAIEVSEY